MIGLLHRRPSSRVAAAAVALALCGAPQLAADGPRAAHRCQCPSRVAHHDCSCPRCRAEGTPAGHAQDALPPCHRRERALAPAAPAPSPRDAQAPCLSGGCSTPEAPAAGLGTRDPFTLPVVDPAPPLVATAADPAPRRGERHFDRRPEMPPPKHA